MCKFTGKIKQIIPFKGEIEKIDSFVGEFIKNYKPPVYDNELPIEWNTVAVANAGNAAYGNPRVKISSLVLTIEELANMQITLSYPYSDGSGEALYELVCTHTDISPDGYDVATFEDATTNRKAYFTIVPKGESIPHGLYWAHNNYSANEVTESGWNYKLYVPAEEPEEPDIPDTPTGIYDDEFPISWNSLAVVEAGNVAAGQATGNFKLIKVSNLTPAIEELQSAQLTLVSGADVYTLPFVESEQLSDSVLQVVYADGFAFIIYRVSEPTELDGIHFPESGLYVNDFYTMAGENIDITLSLAQSATQYLYGHEAEATVSYNGVVLPDIESVWTDKETYPYAALFPANDVMPYTTLMLSAVPFNNVNVSGKYQTYTDDLSKQPICAYLPDGLPEGVELEIVNGWVLFGENNGIVTSAFWSNVDIPNGTWASLNDTTFVPDGSVYLAASDPVKSYPDADVIIDGVGYVGAVLPALPEWDDCPYLFIVPKGGTLKGYLRGYPVKPVVKSKEDVWGGDNYDVVYLDSENPYYRHTVCSINKPTEWYQPYSAPINGDGEELLDWIGWTNFDLYTSSGELYLKATEPIPVYDKE